MTYARSCQALSLLRSSTTGRPLSRFARNPTRALATTTTTASSNTPPPLIKTACYDLHKELGGDMVPFAGYELPVLYKGDNTTNGGVLKEHLWCRTHAALFDVSHMGQVSIECTHVHICMCVCVCLSVGLLGMSRSHGHSCAFTSHTNQPTVETINKLTNTHTHTQKDSLVRRRPHCFFGTTRGIRSSQFKTRTRPS
jgi:hypothetical protein